MNKHLATLLLLSIVISLAAPAAPCTAAQNAPAQWTVLVYLDGDNNLEREAINDMLEMSTIGSNEAINIIVQFDRAPGYDHRYGDWTGTLRFRVGRGMTPQPANAIQDLGEVNMGDPQTLIDFVTWGMTTFPAQRVALVLWNHGDGWRTASAVKKGRKAICWDDSSGRDALDSAELRRAMDIVTRHGATPLDLVAFDACLMAMIEIDAQLRPYAGVRVASEETEPGTGYPFDTILADLHAHPEWDGAALGTAIVDRYYQAYHSETQSAVNLSGSDYPALIQAVDRLAQTLLDHQADEIDAIKGARREVQQFQASYVDLYHLAELLAGKATQDPLRRAAQAVVAAIDNVTLRNQNGASWPGAHGISIYFPAQSNLWDSAYAGENNYLTFTAETRWDEFIIAYLQLTITCDPDLYEPDNAPTAATPFGLNDKPQRHNFCPAADTADWVAVELRAGQTITIATTALERNSDTVIKLYDTDGTTVLAQDDDGGSGRASRLVWTSPAAGAYYIKVLEYYGRTGQDTGYTLDVQAPSAAPPSITISGEIHLQGRHTFSDTLITTQPTSYTTTTTISGTFSLTVTPPCTITAAYPGYLRQRWTVTNATTPRLHFAPITLPGGDINADGQIDILDITFIGARFGGTDPQADLNGDGIVDIRDLVLPAGNFGRTVP